MSHQLFTVSEAAFLADVKVTTLKVWRQRGIVSLKQDEGRGRWGRFTFTDVLKAAVVQSLTDKGVSASDAALIAAVGEKCFPDTFAEFPQSATRRAYLVEIWKTQLIESDKKYTTEFADSLPQLLEIITKNSESPVLERINVTDFAAISAKILFRRSKLQSDETPE